jgi:hypothetical protein
MKDRLLQDRADHLKLNHEVVVGFGLLKDADQDTEILRLKEEMISELRSLGVTDEQLKRLKFV